MTAAMALGIALGQVAPAHAGDCAQVPETLYLGEHPSDAELGYVDNLQGVAHDSKNWYFTGQGYAFLMKVPVSVDLDSDIDPKDPGTWPPGVSAIMMPASLKAAGYEDLKDLDQFDGFLFVPVAGQDPATGAAKAGIAVFQAANLSYKGVFTLEGWTHASAAFYNMNEHLLYVSRSKVSRSVPLARFAVDTSMLASGLVATAFHPAGDRFLTDEDGGPLDLLFDNVQGATFTPMGDLYLVNGGYSPASADRGGIHLFDPDGHLVDESANGGSDPFNFQYDPSESLTSEEPEGADWWNRDAVPGSPHIEGQLHVILLDNDLVSTDQIFFKHYRVDYSCIADADQDQDGLTNGVEIYGTGTAARERDTDVDGLDDGAEVDVLGTDPFKRDSDGDGVQDADEDLDGDELSNVAEIYIHHTDPVEADTDGDLLGDGFEVAHDSDPLDPDTDDDGILDGLDVQFVQMATSSTCSGPRSDDAGAPGRRPHNRWISTVLMVM
ncbi:hypothetical protein [Microbispora sp. KK1-11]|uniref:hypothetical protein n=1 Tax=Microbispora sp. KK1-11 TaxID=2053005 RepID=UPI00115B06A6|nr:hypothetical protein [Microbispora sp. KK1-11]TQS31221.1 hypothetical protein FLW16_02855 [Microbispora sp. KK1-11]